MGQIRLTVSPVDSIKDKVFDWCFTFCGYHTHHTGYVIIRGTWTEARTKMFDEFGTHWGFQYTSKEEAEVDRWGLKEVKIDE